MVRKKKTPPVRPSSERANLRASIVNELYDWKRPAEFARISRTLAARKLRPLSKKEQEQIKRYRTFCRQMSGPITRGMSPMMMRSKLLSEFQDPRRTTRVGALRAKFKKLGLSPPTPEEISRSRRYQKRAKGFIEQMEKTMKDLRESQKALDRTVKKLGLRPPR